MRKMILGVLVGMFVAASAAPLEIVSPKEGATVPTLTPDMKAYLVQRCGIDAGRIFIDEQAMTTVENAIHTFEILRAQGVRTITVVTSTYHQRWGQVIYNAMAAIYRLRYGYDVDIVGNYCFQIEPSHDSYRRDDRIAVRQLTSVLNLPKETVERMQDDLRRAG